MREENAALREKNAVRKEENTLLALEVEMMADKMTTDKMKLIDAEVVEKDAVKAREAERDAAVQQVVPKPTSTLTFRQTQWRLN